MKRVLITGGSGDIGAALVSAFAKDYEVIFTYNTGYERAKRVADASITRAVQCDISDREQVNSLLEQIKECDILINNAGISQCGLLIDINGNDWDKMIGVNLTGIYNVTHAFLPGMIRKKKGAVINISSVWGVYGASCEVHYSAAKAGVIGFTKALAKEVGPSGITVNAVAPGVIEGRMNSFLSEEEKQVIIDETPLSRIGLPDDVADAVLFLAESSFITGQVLGVDGGFGL